MDANTLGQILAAQGGMNPAIDNPAMNPGVALPAAAAIPQVDPAQLRMQFQQAMSGKLPPASEEAKSAALLKLGLSLMQPPQAGQTTAGQLSTAVGGAFDQFQNARAQEAQRNMQSLELGLKMQQRGQEQQKWQLDIAKAKAEVANFPSEQKAKLEKLIAETEKARTDGDEGRAKAAWYKVQAELEPGKTAAEIRRLDAMAGASRASAAKDAATTPKVQSEYTHIGSDGNGSQMVQDRQGRVFVITKPLVMDAQMQADAELKAGRIRKEDYPAVVAQKMQATMQEVPRPGVARPTSPATQAAAPGTPGSVATREQVRQHLAQQNAGSVAAPVVSAAPNAFQPSASWQLMIPRGGF